MKIAICQTAGYPGRVDKNMDQMKQSAAIAADAGAELLIFPEMYLSGYNIGSDLQHLAEPADGPASRMASAIARGSNIAAALRIP